MIKHANFSTVNPLCNFPLNLDKSWLLSIPNIVKSSLLSKLEKLIKHYVNLVNIL